MSETIEQDEFNKAWSDMISLPPMMAEMRRELGRMEEQFQMAKRIVEQARCEANQP